MATNSNVKLSPEVQDVLERCIFTENTLKLPENLDRKLYVSVNKIIELAGGKWSKKSKSHEFPGDPKVKLGLALETGSIVDEKKARQAYYTPPALAARMAVMASVKGHAVLEPSAGGGSLAQACMDAGAEQVFCIDIDPVEVENLRSKGFPAYCTDFLMHKWGPTNAKFMRIVMNPPFTKNQDLKHIRHAVDNWLDKNGILVSIMSPNLDRKEFKVLEILYDTETFDIDAGTFRESGTNIATKLLVLKKN